MTISRPTKKASSKTLKSLKAKVLLMDVKRTRTKCIKLVIMRR